MFIPVNLFCSWDRIRSSTVYPECLLAKLQNLRTKKGQLMVVIITSLPSLSGGPPSSLATSSHSELERELLLLSSSSSSICCSPSSSSPFRNNTTAHSVRYLCKPQEDRRSSSRGSGYESFCLIRIHTDMNLAEPEPVEPKLFETWGRSRNYLFNKYWLLRWRKISIETVFLMVLLV